MNICCHILGTCNYVTVNIPPHPHPPSCAVQGGCTHRMIDTRYTLNQFQILDMSLIMGYFPNFISPVYESWLMLCSSFCLQYFLVCVM
jgi:hypothetical protein